MDKQILQRAVRKFVVICLLHFQIVEQFARWEFCCLLEDIAVM